MNHIEQGALHVEEWMNHVEQPALHVEQPALHVEQRALHVEQPMSHNDLRGIGDFNPFRDAAISLPPNILAKISPIC